MPVIEKYIPSKPSPHQATPTYVTTLLDFFRLETVRSSLLLDFCRKKPDVRYLLLLDF